MSNVCSWGTAGVQGKLNLFVASNSVLPQKKKERDRDLSLRGSKRKPLKNNTKLRNGGLLKVTCYFRFMLCVCVVWVHGSTIRWKRTWTVKTLDKTWQKRLCPNLVTKYWNVNRSSPKDKQQETELLSVVQLISVLCFCSCAWSVRWSRITLQTMSWEMACSTYTIYLRVPVPKAAWHTSSERSHIYSRLTIKQSILTVCLIGFLCKNT